MVVDYTSALLHKCSWQQFPQAGPSGKQHTHAQRGGYAQSHHLLVQLLICWRPWLGRSSWGKIKLSRCQLQECPGPLEAGFSKCWISHLQKACNGVTEQKSLRRRSADCTAAVVTKRAKRLTICFPRSWSPNCTKGGGEGSVLFALGNGEFWWWQRLEAHNCWRQRRATAPSSDAMESVQHPGSRGGTGSSVQWSIWARWAWAMQ